MSPVKPLTDGSGADRLYGGRSGAERAAERREALIEATFALIAQDGWGQLRIERVCARARLNKRYFYESFPDLDAVTASVIDRLADDAITATLAEMHADAPTPDQIRAGITALVHHLVDDPRRARVLFAEAPRDEAGAAQRAEAVHRIVAVASAQGRAINDIGAQPDQASMDLAASVLVGGTIQAVLDWLDGRLHKRIEDFIDALVVLWQVVSDAAAEQSVLDADG